MRILLVNGTSFGGSLLSTRALARALARRGHHAAVLRARAGRPRTLWAHKRLENLRARAGATPLAAIADRLARLPGRRPRASQPGGSFAEWQAAVPANALGEVLGLFRPDIVVAASMLRPQWRQVQSDLGGRGIPSVLYLREQASLAHLDPGRPLPDLLLANSAALADAAAGLGHRAAMIPSVVDIEESLVVSTRARVLVVNPLPGYGGERAREIAERCPEIPFVFQESWHLGAAAAALRAPGLPNVECRCFAACPADVYRDARLLLVPYGESLAGARPRSVLEAQGNGIPVVASALPGLAESIGPGGVLVDPHAPGTAWAGELRRLWADPSRYAALSAAARAHASRPEVSPDRIAEDFCAAVAPLLPGV